MAESRPTERRPAARPRHRGWRWVVGAGIVLLVAPVAAVLILLATGADRAVVVREALALVNDQIAGRIEADQVRLFPDGHLIARQISIRGPDGETIISARAVDTHVDLAALAQRRLRLERTRIEGARVVLATDDRERLNIARAFELRHPSRTTPAATPPSRRVPLAIEIPDGEATVDRAQFVRADPRQPVVALEGAVLTTSFNLDPNGRVRVRLTSLRAQARIPVAGGLAIEGGSFSLLRGVIDADCQASLDDSKVGARAHFDLSSSTGEVDASQVTIGPQLLARWIPQLDPRALQGTLQGSIHGRNLVLEALRLSPRGGGAGIAGDGRLDLRTGDARAHLRTTEIDLHDWLGRLPVTRLGVDITADATHVLDDAREVSGRLTMTRGVVSGQAIGPGAADVSLAGSVVDVAGLSLGFPGGRVRGEGRVSALRMKAHVHVEAPHLAALRPVLRALVEKDVPRFDGALVADISLDGPWSAPAVHAVLSAPHASLSTLGAEGLSAHLDAPLLSRHMDLRGQLTIKQLDVADRTFRGVRLAVDWATPDLRVEAHGRELGQPIAVTAQLDVPPSFRRARLNGLRLHAAGTDWVLEQPAIIDLGHGVAVDRLALRCPPQRVAASIRLSSHELSIDGRVESLDLSRLPAAVLPSLGLKGKVTGTASYAESAGDRVGDLDVRLTRVSVRGLAIPQGEAEASLEGRRLLVHAGARVGGGSMSLSGSLPLPRQPGTIDLRLDAQEISLSDLAGLAPHLKGVTGLLDGHVVASGDWLAPKVEVVASAANLAGPWGTNPAWGDLGQPLGAQLDLDLDATGVDEKVVVSAPRRTLVAMNGTWDLPSRRLVDALRHPRQLLAAVQRAPLDQHVRVTHIPIEPLLSLASAQMDASGTISGTADLRGSVGAPRGELAARGESFVWQHHPLGEVELSAVATDRGLKVRAEVQPSHGKLIASAAWAVPPEGLRDARTRSAARLTAEAYLSGVPLSALMGDDAALQGVAEGSAWIDGTLATLSAGADASLHDLELSAAPMGDLTAHATWSGDRLVAVLRGRQPQGGRLEARADVPIALRGPSRASEPVRAHVTATRFELSPITALAARSGVVRTVRGRLDGDLTVGGTLGAPEPTGALELSGGQVALVGYGELDDLTAHVDVSPTSATTVAMACTSRSGTLQIHGVAHRQPQGFAVDAQIDTDGFGVYQADRLLGLLTSREELTGTIGPEHTQLRLDIHRAVLNLPQLVPKSTAPLTLDHEIVLGPKKRAPASRPSSSTYAVELEVHAPDVLEVKGTDVQIKARADLTLVAQQGVRIQGGVYTTQGEINAYGRRFRVDHANVTFGSKGTFGPASSPEIDARAEETIDQYRLYLDAHGTPATLAIATSTEPPLDKEQVGDLLVTGSAEAVHAPLQSETPGGGLAAASAVGGYVTEKVRESLGPYMPLDVLTVEPTRVEAGKQITPRLYLGAVENGSVNDPRVNGTEVHARYKLGGHWAVDTRYGTAQAGNLDLEWSKSW